MKTTYPLLLIFFLFNSASAKCSWSIYINVYNDGIIVADYNKLSPLNLQANISPFDSVLISGWGDYDCSPYIEITHNGDTISFLDYYSFGVVLTDAGHYHLHFHNSNAVLWNRDLEIIYVTTDVQAIQNESKVQFYKTESNVYKIESASRLKHILVSDNAGRIVYESRSVSELNLNAFSSGVYIYAIIDENEKVWRGKLIRN